MAVVIITNQTFESPLPGGQKLIHGYANVGTYATGGASFNLSNYFSDSAPCVIINPSNSAWQCAFNGNSTTGSIVVSNAVTGEQAANATNLTAMQVQFIALGKAY